MTTWQVSKISHNAQMRLSPKGIQNIKRGLKRSWESGSHRARQQTRKPDADDLMRRSLYDRRGKIVMSGSLSTELGQKPFQIRWSVFGRTDQLDFIVDGIIEKTCRPSAMMGFILSICGGHWQFPLDTRCRPASMAAHSTTSHPCPNENSHESKLSASKTLQRYKSFTDSLI